VRNTGSYDPDKVLVVELVLLLVHLWLFMTGI